MCLPLRKTFRRRRSGVPLTTARMRRLRFRRMARALCGLIICLLKDLGRSHPAYGAVPARRLLLLAADLTGLTGLAADHFVAITDALTLIGLGRAQPSYLGGGLADDLLVDTAHRDRVCPSTPRLTPLGATTSTGCE